MMVLEGPDGAGKSTLARVLSNLTGAGVFHPGGAPDPGVLEILNKQCINMLEQGFICDRVNQISEYVYGPVMNDRKLTSLLKVIDFFNRCLSKGWPIIYCRPVGIKYLAENQTSEVHDTEENTLKLKANHERLVEGYDEVFSVSGAPSNVFVYSYNKPGALEHLLEFLRSFGIKTQQERPTTEEYFSSMASLVSSRGTCCRRKVGCVLTNNHKHVIATGYNGRPKGFDHCSEGSPCAAANSPSGTNLDGCEALHAEQNALLQCKDVFEIDTAYVTTFPCVTCTKLLLNTSCKKIVYQEDYCQPEAIELWERAGRTIIQMGED